MRYHDIRDALQELQLRPSKGLGQNFLRDANIARVVAEMAVPRSAPFALEIGPGLGAITTHLMDRCDRLLALEKDDRLAAWLRLKLPPERIDVETADAVTFDWRPLMRHGPFPVIGNLPYYVTSPILRNFLGPVSPASRAVFGVQDEFAARMVAAPGSPDYSALTVRLQRIWRIRRERSLPPAVFHPAPGVSSAIVSLEPLSPRTHKPVRAAFFDDIVQRGFGQRRKQLRSLLEVEPALWQAWCDRNNLPPTCRAENLSVAQWVDLAAQLDPSCAVPAQHDHELFDVVDENDCVVRSAPRGEVHGNNLRHRSVHVLIFNSAGELLLQKRSAWKDREPLKWDSSAAGHLDAGEDYTFAAGRETEEELGIRTALERIGKIPAGALTGHEFVEVFTGRHEGPFVMPPAEVEAAEFFPLDVISGWMTTRPDDFAPGLCEAWRVLSAARDRK